MVEPIQGVLAVVGEEVELAEVRMSKPVGARAVSTTVGARVDKKGGPYGSAGSGDDEEKLICGWEVGWTG